MTPEQEAKLEAIYDFVVGRGNPRGMDELTYWNDDGNSMLERFLTMETAMVDVMVAIPAAPLSDHRHTIAWKDVTGGVIRD